VLGVAPSAAAAAVLAEHLGARLQLAIAPAGAGKTTATSPQASIRRAEKL
jgi:ATP/maltotriose-dependent transcriptional regulator MalT